MQFPGLALFRAACVLALAAAVPCRAAGATSAPAAAASHEWSLWVAPGIGTFSPSGFYRPITEGPDYAYSLHATLTRRGAPVSLRFDLAWHGNSASFDDHTVTYETGEPWPYGSIDAFVGNTETWTALGLQWDPNPHGTGYYGFLSGGRLKVEPHAEAGARDLVVHDLPLLPDASSAWGFMAGGGVRGTFGRHRTHALYVEGGWMRTMPVTYVGTPSVVSDLGHTVFPIEYAGAIETNVRFGYTYAFRWGGVQ